MNRNEITASCTHIYKLLSEKKTASAMALIKKTIEVKPLDALWVSYENAENTYALILEYAIKGVEDPQREDVYNKLIKSLFELTDKIKIHLLKDNGSSFFNPKNNSLSKGRYLFNTVKDLHESSSISGELSEILSEMHISNQGQEDLSLIKEDLFYYFLYKEILTEEDTAILDILMSDKWFDENNRCLIISALTLNLLNHFDTIKITWLAGLSLKLQPQISERAFTGIMQTLFAYDSRLAYYPEIEKVIKPLALNPDIITFTAFLAIQLIKAGDTEKFTKKLRDEIMPDILKHAPKIQERLDLDNILPEDEDKNPKWEQILQDAPDLMEKLEELSKLQIEGTDIFMGTFSMLKNFPFFQKTANWLVPFYPANPEIASVFENDSEDFKNTFLMMLERAAHMCNSDKYSFCLNISALPESQKNMMLQMFRSELENINDMFGEDQKTDKTLSHKIVFQQYIQDQYRFFKLYPNRHEFVDIFEKHLHLYNKTFFVKYFFSESLFFKLADFYFENAHYADAGNIYEILIANGQNTQVVFEKAAFAYQQINRFEKALTLYKKAELFESTVWLLSKIAHCHIRLNNYEEALKFFADAEMIEPENLKIQLQIANCHLNLNRIETALEHYFKLELLADSNIRVLRPIAWCLFILKRYEEAEKYFNMLMQSPETNQYDYMNYGHWLWCTGQDEKAAEAYLKSIGQKNNTFDAFVKSFSQDEKHLKEAGLNSRDIAFMLDYLELKLKG